MHEGSTIKQSEHNRKLCSKSSPLVNLFYPLGMATFSVYVSKADFRFNCAHFIAFKGFRERLHGHNYRLSIKITGTESIGDDGYVIDFGDIKKATRKLCKTINEYFLCPMKSDALSITEIDNQICLVCEDGSKFSFPRKDVQMLPLVHSSAEELSHYFWCKIIRFVSYSIIIIVIIMSIFLHLLTSD